MTTLTYNQVRQKGSHNSYQRTEGYADQALYWRIRSLEIDIHTSNNTAGWPALSGDWYVYHLAGVDQNSSVNRLSDALAVLRAFHLAVPDHEVITVWLDLKDGFSSAGRHTPQGLDQLLAAILGRDSIWGPPDLIGDSADLQAAVGRAGWPRLADLRGKFIFACTTGDLSSADSQLNQYVENGKTAAQRLAFVAPEITRAQQITQFNYAVFFNLDARHAGLATQVNAQGLVARAYGLDGASSWTTAWNAAAQHLTTNAVNALHDPWARTDVAATGYPFTAIGSTATNGQVEAGALYAIQLTSGDIWGSADSCYFQYDTYPRLGAAHTAFVGNPCSHVNGWIKAGVMARASTDANAAYVAVLRTGNNGLRLQVRSASGKATTATDAVIPRGPNGKPLVSPNTPMWLRLVVAADGRSASGYYAIDGAEWRLIGSAPVEAPLALHGWVASTHGSGQVKWLFGGAPPPGTGVAIGSKASGTFIADSAAAASLGPKGAQGLL